VQARTVAEAALDDLKAADIVYINLDGKASFADGMLVATATSSRHAASLADTVEEALCKHKFPILSIQGKNGGDWVLVDAGDIVVHIFQPDARKLYNLEKLWSF
ncbi:MAG: ribosome silencing factor, partial [Alphaproteobacteria bacterium]